MAFTRLRNVNPAAFLTPFTFFWIAKENKLLYYHFSSRGAVPRDFLCLDLMSLLFTKTKSILVKQRFRNMC